MKKNILQQVRCVMGIILLTLLMCGCDNSGLDGSEQTGDTNQDNEAMVDGLFLLLEHDTLSENLTLYSYETGEEYQYPYSISTAFVDKFGNNEPVVRFTEGKVVELEKLDTHGNLTEVRISDEVWEQSKVKRFSIDVQKGVFSIGSSNYSIKDEVSVFSHGEKISIENVSTNDVLTVVGKGNKILSVVVTTGNGTLVVKNTDLFNGSLLKLDNDIYAKISEGLSIEVQEGKHTLTVANDGWGGTCEITINRGETTEVDLDAMKGPGKKKGLISFAINLENVRVYIDSQLVDHSQEVEVTYGTHTLHVVAPGYEVWKRYLVVNSEKATIIVELETDEPETEEKEENTESKDTETKPPKGSSGT